MPSCARNLAWRDVCPLLEGHLPLLDADSAVFVRAALQAAKPRLSAGDLMQLTSMVNWLSEAAQELGVSDEALHRSVALLERFASATARQQLSLPLPLSAAAAALWVAAKFEDVDPPTLQVRFFCRLLAAKPLSKAHGWGCCTR